MQDIQIAPSILSADFSKLGAEIKTVESGGADVIHYDVMDAHFVPNLTIGPLVLKDIRKCTKLPIDVHLMITDPDEYIPQFAKAGADWISFHYEASKDSKKSINLIKENGAKAGIVIKPKTPVSDIEPFLSEVDFVLIMSVEPGFGGQGIIPECLDKIRELRTLLSQKGLDHVRIEIDGGVKLDNLKEVIDSGAQIIVAGSAVFKADDPADMVRQMKVVQ